MPITLESLSELPTCSAPKPYHAGKATFARITSIALACIALFSAGLLIAGAVGASIGSFGIIPSVALITMASAGGVLSGYFHQISNWASRLENDPAYQTFEAYVASKCAGISLEQAAEWADEGATIIQEIGRGKSSSYAKQIPNDQIKGEMLQKVSWYFMKLAIETGQGFDQGTIKFVDPQHCIAKFFEPIMYDRASSHFRKTRSSSKGFDPKGPLPNQLKHIHMGQLKQPEDATTPHFSFFKLEPAGTKGVRSFLAHTVSFIYAKILKKIAFEASGPNDRKEHTKTLAMKKTRNIFLKALLKSNREAFEKLKTPSDMYRFASRLKGAHGAGHAQHLAAGEFTKAIEAMYPKTLQFLPYAEVGAAFFNPFLPATMQSLTGEAPPPPPILPTHLSEEYGRDELFELSLA